MANEIKALDRALARAGSTITLRKITLTTTQTFTDLANVPAAVRGYTPQELTTNIAQQDSNVIISPTQINAAVWPGTQVPGTPDIRIPSKNRGDQVNINGQWRTVQAAVGIYLPNGLLVRIEMQVR